MKITELKPVPKNKIGEYANKKKRAWPRGLNHQVALNKPIIARVEENSKRRQKNH